MKWIFTLALSLLLSACGCHYNGIDTREVLIASKAPEPSFQLNDESIDVTAAQVTYTHWT